jgi:hypothetical protein
MATFIKNNCECCQPAVCESCNPCANSITTTKQFLAPGSEPQEGVILLPNTVTVQLANIDIRPCGCDSPYYPTIPCGSPECEVTIGFSLCEDCELSRAGVISTLYDPKVVEYYDGGVDGISGYFSFGGYVPALSPNNIFVLGTRDYAGPCNNIYIGNAPPYVCDGYGQYFYSCSLIAETANSLTYAGSIGWPLSGAIFVHGSGGTATITW